ncbi:MAG: imidazolonepropionase [Candidatus Eremiobacteraeota bacterium]|nr:imidazolonepropionase [Candidatus Eremiobacteraeota bacterium]
MWDRLWVNARLATMHLDRPYGVIPDGALAVDGERIAWVGARNELPAAPERSAREVIDAGGRLVTPGLIDCHTHVVYAGNRALEFEMRLQGATYEEIANAGGGILSTVAATRTASFSDLVGDASRRLAQMVKNGTTTVEIKSGYGLDLETELRMLRVARELAVRFPVDVHTTYLGGHAVPPEFVGRSDDYVTFMIETVLPEVASDGLAEAVDVFCERIAFTPQQARRLLSRARERGLGIKVHAEQLSNAGGALLAAEMGALSADHLEHATDKSLAAMAAAGTVAVLVPGASLFLRDSGDPPVEAMRRHGLRIAVATDCNPGTSPLVSLPLAMNLACTLYRLTPEEALRGTTVNAARALGIHQEVGALAAGLRADFVVWEAREPAELPYSIGENLVSSIVKRGRAVREPLGEHAVGKPR